MFRILILGLKNASIEEREKTVFYVSTDGLNTQKVHFIYWPNVKNTLSEQNKINGLYMSAHTMF